MPKVPIETLTYKSVDSRQMIGEIRLKAMQYVASLSLAAFAFPVAIGGLFDLTKLGENRCYFLSFLISGCAFALVSILAAMIFVVSVPKHIECYERRCVLNSTYVIAPMSFGFSVILFAFATYYALDLPPATN